MLGRGNIQQIRFAPGRGNMKILVLHNDGVAIWDIKVRYPDIQVPVP
jgi:hypothetical protein